MSIKKLLPLIFLIVVPFVGFGFVKPLVDSVMMNQSEKDRKAEELAAIRRTRENFGKLVSARAELMESDRGRALSEYLPTEPEQERVMDMTNYIALQSGVVLQDAVFAKQQKRSAVSDVTASKRTASPSLTPPTKPEARSRSVTIDFLGSYESARDFLRGLSSSGRYGLIREFSIMKESERSGEAEEAVPSDLLSCSVTLDIFYLPEQTYPQAHLLPVFSSGKFDTTPIDRLIEQAGDRIPPIPSPDGAGRANPFVS